MCLLALPCRLLRPEAISVLRGLSSRDNGAVDNVEVGKSQFRMPPGKRRHWKIYRSAQESGYCALRGRPEGSSTRIPTQGFVWVALSRREGLHKSLQLRLFGRQKRQLDKEFECAVRECSQAERMVWMLGLS